MDTSAFTLMVTIYGGAHTEISSSYLYCETKVGALSGIDGAELACICVVSLVHPTFVSFAVCVYWSHLAGCGTMATLGQGHP